MTSYKQSGNKVIDDFISNIVYVSYGGECEFVPYDQFENIEFIANGGFGKVFKATWIDGPISDLYPYYRKRNYTVVLKKLDNSKNITSKELNELKILYRTNQSSYDFINRYHGITIDPITKDIIIIMDYYNSGDLVHYLSNDFYNISWETKLDLLFKIIQELEYIHSSGIIHRNLHSGNVLIGGYNTYIGDLGISKSAIECTNDNEKYGVIPYMAPEIFLGQKYTKASDIYSFGMIMWEFMTGRRPFWDQIHDTDLIIAICDGLRLPIITNAPEGYIEVMIKCWHPDPEKRPTANDIYWRIFSLIKRECNNNPTQIIKSPDIGPVTINNPGAIYKSRSLGCMIQSVISLRGQSIDKRSKPELSNNKIIDNFIQSYYIKVNKRMIFVPYDQFKNIEFIAEGGFSKIYKATWIDSPVFQYNIKHNTYKKNYTVVLKKLNNFKKELNKEFYQIFSQNDINCISKYFGITIDPITRDIIIIMSYYNLGNLTYYLSNKFYSISWETKLNRLEHIIYGLNYIHNDVGIIHRNLHSGNIFIGEYNTYIGDLGINKSVFECTNDNEKYGVIPYMAPEIFLGQKYTKASDIYSFGMIMWEFMTGRRPFWDRNHGMDLIIDICDGLRPPIVTNAPKGYVELMKECWNSDPGKRPIVNEIYWRINSFFDREYINTIQIIKSPDIGSVIINNPGAIFKSRSLGSIIKSAMSLRGSRVQPISEQLVYDLYNECKIKETISDNQQLLTYQICYNVKKMLKPKLSGNKVIDDFITYTQINSDNGKMEFVPYNQFKDIEFIAEGGFSKIYKATWIDGPIDNWDEIHYVHWYIVRKNNYAVVLKKLNNSKNITSKELNELKVSYQISSSKSISTNCIVRYFGITQDPITKDIMIIMPYYDSGDLMRYLKNDFYHISWKTKLYELGDIIKGLAVIHDSEIIHKDLHSGNIFFDTNKHGDGYFPYIGDLGISKSATESTENQNENYGIIPYMAPEIFQGQKYTKASDIYSFGMIMWEFMTCRRPFWNEDHDIKLIIKICDGLRPPIVTNAPEGYIELMKECWYSDPKERPEATNIRARIDEMMGNEWQNESFQKPTEIMKSSDIGPVMINNPGAIYKSRPLSCMIQSAMSLRSSRDQSNVKRKVENNTIEDTINNDDKSIKKRKLCDNENNVYISKEIELDINANFNQTPDKEYVTKEFDIDINDL
ncbi:hypothetical protein RclHR1_07180007 [Rhizophagus clarus]|uniref:Protein kinase domain-containing protein n=1 Tax=Rhizophagus clarus TaxID=94130 RepID=A0A2Z6SC74_9GLOM|nr:hypothetical protein RclHR1_07180007 [Rhizophagus clarus]